MPEWVKLLPSLCHSYIQGNKKNFRKPFWNMHQNILYLQSSLSTRWYEQRATSSFRVPESLYHPRLMLEKLANSFESRDELRWCFLRRKKLRLADVEPRLASASKSPKLRRKSNSSSTLWQKHLYYYYKPWKQTTTGQTTNQPTNQPTQLTDRLTNQQTNQSTTTIPTTRTNTAIQ